jgi:ABC-2 type transport system ATP-binding protein
VSNAGPYPPFANIPKLSSSVQIEGLFEVRIVPVIVTDQLAKSYGKIGALKGVSLTVERGEIFGLLGQNGAGKTTLIKILLGITRATRGHVTLLDRPAGTAAVRRRVGYLPEDHRFPDYHTGASLLDFYGALLEMPRAQRRQRAPEVLELVGLRGRMHYKIRTYSKGMKQRLGVAQALMHDPEIIFLDEPTDGVDPVGRREIRDLMQGLKAQGKTIFLNSHLLSEVEQICDRVAILQRGLLIREGDIATLTRQQGLFVIGLAPGQVFPTEEVTRQGYRVTRSGDCWEVALTDGQTIDPVVDLLHQRGLHLRHLVEKRQTLEDLFLQTVEEAEPGIDRAAPRAPSPRQPGSPRARSEERR